MIDFDDTAIRSIVFEASVYSVSWRYVDIVAVQSAIHIVRQYVCVIVEPNQTHIDQHVVLPVANENCVVICKEHAFAVPLLIEKTALVGCIAIVDHANRGVLHRIKFIQ
jgi:hypothetical protein